MHRTSVVSSSVRAVGYSEPSMTLEVEFCSGDVYQYLGVGPDQHAALLASPSKGKFVNGGIKGCYEYRRVQEAQR